MSRTEEHPADLLRRLARSRWAVVAGAFVLGWVLFLLVVTRQSGEPAPGEAAPAAALAALPSEPLPAPMPAGTSAPLPRTADGEEPRLVEEAPAPEPVQPEPETVEPAPVEPAPVAPVASSIAQAPELLPGQPAPRYPASALRRGESGTVVLRVQVDAEGRAGDVEIVERSGSRELDRAAAEAALRWRFRPARDGEGRPLPGEAIVPVEFRTE